MILQLLGACGLAALSGAPLNNSINIDTGSDYNSSTEDRIDTIKLSFENAFSEFTYQYDYGDSPYPQWKRLSFVNSDGAIDYLDNVTLAQAMVNADALGLRFGVYTIYTGYVFQGLIYAQTLDVSFILPANGREGSIVTFDSMFYSDLSAQIQYISISGMGFNNHTIYHYSYDAGSNFPNINAVYTQYPFMIPYGGDIPYTNGYVYPITTRFSYKPGAIQQSTPNLGLYLQVKFKTLGNNAYFNGYNDGREYGKREGESIGYQNGYNAGYTDGFSTDSTAATIFSGIVNVALIPINFFLACLNFDVFGINIGGFVSALLTVCIVIIIVRMITGRKTSGD